MENADATTTTISLTTTTTSVDYPDSEGEEQALMHLFRKSLQMKKQIAEHKRKYGVTPKPARPPPPEHFLRKRGENDRPVCRHFSGKVARFFGLKLVHFGEIKFLAPCTSPYQI